MAEDFEWESRGFDELAAKLEAIGQQATGPRARRMVRAGAEVFKKEMVDRAPLLTKKTTGSDSLDPGELKRSIRVLLPKSVEPVEARIGPRGSELIRVATDVEYGHREVHGGSLTLLGNGKTKGSGAAGEDVPAHPFVRPAFEAAEAEAEQAMMQDFDQPFEERR